MLLLIFFLSVTVPFRISFESNPTYDWIMLDIIIDALFSVDVMFNFFTAYEDENGELVVNRIKIAKTYMKSWSFVDLISSIPITAI